MALSIERRDRLIARLCALALEHRAQPDVAAGFLQAADAVAAMRPPSRESEEVRQPESR